MLGEAIKGLTGYLSLGADIVNYQAQKQANAINQQNNIYNQQLASQQFAYQQNQDARNFQEQQYLNRNANQIRVADMAKAGLNPMSGSGSTLSAGSGSSVGGNQASTSQIQGAQVTGLGFSAMSELGSQLMSNVQNQKDRENARWIAHKGNENARSIANMQDETRLKELALENAKLNEQIRQFDAKAKHDFNLTDAQIEETKARTASTSESTRSTKFTNDYEESLGVPIAGQGQYTKEVLGAAKAAEHALSNSDSDVWNNSSTILRR